MNVIELKESVTPSKFGEFKYIEYKRNGITYRDTIMSHDDGFEETVITESLTPNCGWVVDDTNPSSKCNKCSKNCIEYIKYKREEEL